MSYSYNKTTWVNDSTPLNARNMNNIESGIETAIGGLNYLDGRISNFLTSANIQTDCLLRTNNYNSDGTSIADYTIPSVATKYYLRVIENPSAGNSVTNGGIKPSTTMSFDNYYELTFIPQLFGNASGSTITVPMEFFKKQSTSAGSRIMLPMGPSSSNTYQIYYVPSQGMDLVYIIGNATTSNNSAYGLEIWGTKLVTETNQS